MEMNDTYITQTLCLTHELVDKRLWPDCIDAIASETRTTLPIDSPVGMPSAQSYSLVFLHDYLETIAWK
jgi:hypothetical protein